MNRILALAAIAALPLLAAPAAGQGVPAGAAEAAGPLRVQSTVAALRFVALQRLPRAPAAAPRDLCQHLLETPRTPAGRQVAAAGWGVTGEVAIGPYQAVSFVGSMQPGTSGTCELGDGNIGIFRGTELAAIAYAPAGGGRTIGRALAFERDALRIWDGDFLSQPLADMRLVDGGLTILPLAAEERVCGGGAAIPNIYGKPIDEARALLRQSGWSPVTAARSPAAGADADPRLADLARRGVPEAEACSGTGFGFCSYNYRGAAGRLEVTTVGDNDFPSVSGYAVRCQ